MTRFVRAGCIACLAALAFSDSAVAQGVAWDTVTIKYQQIAGNQFALMRNLRSGQVTVRGPDEKAHKEYLDRYAKSLVFPATEKQYYIPASDDFQVKREDENFQNRLNDLNSILLIPTPENRVDQMTRVRADYVEAFGVALDDAIAAALRKPDMPPVVRTNLGRLLAVAAKSGATAQGKTIQKMLDHTYFIKDTKPQDTPPEVLLYALQGAGNLLSAYDITLQNSKAATRHTLPEDDLMKFLITLQKYAVQGPTKPLSVYVPSPDGSGRAIDLNEKIKPVAAAAAAPGQPKATAELLPEQIAVTVFYRRAAIKSLANCRFMIIGGAGGTADVRPALTLARIAVDDASIPIPVTAAEALEATIGLANMEPSRSLDLPSYAAALAVGARRAAGPRAASQTDTTLPAKIAGLRLTEAFQALAKRAKTNPRLNSGEKLFADLANIVVEDISGRLAGEANAGAAPDFSRLDTYLSNLPAAPEGRKLFDDQANSKLTPRAPR